MFDIQILGMMLNFVAGGMCLGSAMFARWPISGIALSTVVAVINIVLGFKTLIVVVG